jgi:hypothetical protein
VFVEYIGNPGTVEMHNWHSIYRERNGKPILDRIISLPV